MIEQNYSSYQILMTLSGMAYAGNEADIANLLTEKKYATEGNWEIVWFGIDDENLMYVVQESGYNTYAIVIRGTVWKDWRNVLEDFDAFNTQPWGEGYIAKGMYDGLQALNAMTYNNASLNDFINGITGDDLQIYVTGHSLGGALASLLGLQLKETYSDLACGVYTFASPTVGDINFANYYNAALTDACRIYNVSDFIPAAYGNLNLVMLEGKPVGTTGLAHATMGAILDLVLDKLSANNLSYVQVGMENTIMALENNPLVPVWSPLPDPLPGPQVSELKELGDWFSYQHGHQTYLELLEAPILPSIVAMKAQGLA